MNSICCRGMQTKAFQSSDNIVEAISKKSHCYGYYFEIETMENLKIFQNKSNSYEAYYCNY